METSKPFEPPEASILRMDADEIKALGANDKADKVVPAAALRVLKNEDMKLSGLGVSQKEVSQSTTAQLSHTIYRHLNRVHRRTAHRQAQKQLTRTMLTKIG